ncbi:SulP family inorganic anion transporter [Luteolibacter yonseiensis]|uniref:SulP family inorganic anion transporter n=1 Tax=Luteolibacter yonseiensis TaxID=1144680 RepID=A0A934R5J1_9BACT|nr:SulP family inorganic anion transporter [Luteolibacter yonseiensis]MBK1816631.1 SulP family inorganic anion transporter [Luteolibacter yonseiensis]
MKISRTLAHLIRDVRDFFAAERVVFAPFLRDLRHYDVVKFRADAWAGANVTVLAIAQGIAFAAIAGLPVVYGIISTAVAAFVAPLFAGSRHTILGPTNATAFMLFSFFSVNPGLTGRLGELIPLLVMMVGIMAAVGAVFRVADLLQYISRSVLVGYISGAAVLIVANQLKPFLGLSGVVDEETSSTFIGLLFGLLRALPQTHWVSLLIGGGTLLVFVAMRKWRPAWPAFALSLLVSSVIFGSLIRSGHPAFKGEATFATFGFPDLMLKMPHLVRADIFTDISALLSIAFALAFLASLENTLMAKTLASKTGDRPDVNQDMLAVGMANLATAVAGGMPASGSLTRSMLNHESGARTRFASLISGIYTMAFAALIAASVGWGVPLIDYVPKAALAALVIALSFSLFNLRHIRICLRSTTDDAVVLVTTFVATLLAPLHVAIFIGVAISITLFLRKASRPFLIEYEFSEAGELREMGEKRQRPIPAISIVHVEGDLFFGAAELFRTQIQRTVSDPAIQVIILRLKNARHLDATSVMALEDLILYMRKEGLHLIVSGATREVYRVLKKSGILVTLQAGCDRRAGESNIFLTNPRNPNLSTRAALKRAQQLLGTDKADIRIFYDPNKHAAAT